MKECGLFYLKYCLYNFKLPKLKANFLGALWYHKHVKQNFPEYLTEI